MIKTLAVFSMLMDHIGLMFFPDILWLRFVGRLAMPLFAFAVARAFSGDFDDAKALRYAIRLGIFALVSQIPYSFMVSGTLNIVFTWFFGFSLLYIFKRSVLLPGILGILSILLCAFLTPLEYGICGVFYPLMFYICLFKYKNYVLTLCGSLTLYFIYGLQFDFNLIQVLSIFAVPVILVFNNIDKQFRLNKWFYYTFYPVHISLLVTLNYLIP